MVWQGTAQDMSKPLNITKHCGDCGTPSCDSGRKRCFLQGGGVAFKNAPGPFHVGRLPRRPKMAQVATWVSWGLPLNGYLKNQEL